MNNFELVIRFFLKACLRLDACHKRLIVCIKQPKETFKARKTDVWPIKSEASEGYKTQSCNVTFIISIFMFFILRYFNTIVCWESVSFLFNFIFYLWIHYIIKLFIILDSKYDHLTTISFLINIRLCNIK